LFFLEASGGGRILLVNSDGSGRKVIVTGGRIPDGLVVDADTGHIYWTNMGVPTSMRRHSDYQRRKHEMSPLWRETEGHQKVKPPEN
jgi:hypothetical protein